MNAWDSRPEKVQRMSKGSNRATHLARLSEGRAKCVARLPHGGFTTLNNIHPKWIAASSQIPSLSIESECGIISRHGSLYMH